VRKQVYYGWRHVWSLEWRWCEVEIEIVVFGHDIRMIVIGNVKIHELGNVEMHELNMLFVGVVFVFQGIHIYLDSRLNHISLFFLNDCFICH
jgi:extradiol dioxygenase family protein